MTAKNTVKKRLGKIMAICLAMIILMGTPALALAENGQAGAIKSEEAYLMHEEAFSKDRKLTGLFAAATEYFRTGDWEIEKARLVLSLSASPLVRQEVSDFTISLNDRPVHSERIPLTKGEIYQAEIILPADAMREGVNSLLIESYIRTNETDPCADDVSRASWLTVLRHPM